MRFHPDGDAEPGGQRRGVLQYPRRRPELTLAPRRRAEVAAEHADQRRPSDTAAARVASGNASVLTAMRGGMPVHGCVPGVLPRLMD